MLDREPDRDREHLVAVLAVAAAEFLEQLCWTATKDTV